MAVSRALMQRVAQGELPETLRLTRPGAMVAFAKQDAVTPGYAAAVAAARGQGFEAVLRLAGGRAAVFHDQTIALAHAVPDAEPRAGIHARFEWTARLIVRALRGLGADARVGEVAGEYCPGGYSVNARGAAKLAGIGQRIVAGGSAHGRGDRGGSGRAGARRACARVRGSGPRLGPGHGGGGRGGTGWPIGGLAVDRGGDALLAEYGREHELVEAELDAETLELAHGLAAEHLPA